MRCGFPHGGWWTTDTTPRFSTRTRSAGIQLQILRQAAAVHDLPRKGVARRCPSPNVHNSIRPASRCVLMPHFRAPMHTRSSVQMSRAHYGGECPAPPPDRRRNDRQPGNAHLHAHRRWPRGFCRAYRAKCKASFNAGPFLAIVAEPRCTDAGEAQPTCRNPHAVENVPYSSARSRI